MFLVIEDGKGGCDHDGGEDGDGAEPARGAIGDGWEGAVGAAFHERARAWTRGGDEGAFRAHMGGEEVAELEGAYAGSRYHLDGWY